MGRVGRGLGGARRLVWQELGFGGGVRSQLTEGLTGHGSLDFVLRTRKPREGVIKGTQTSLDF